MMQVFLPNQPHESLHQVIRSITSILYKQAPRHQVEVAALYHIYLMLMLHIQENISFYDTDTILLFNRTMTQLGLAAFRTGAMVYAHNCLDDLVNIGSRNGLIRVLLAQGSDMTDEELQVIQERRKVFPHMVYDL